MNSPFTPAPDGFDLAVAHHRAGRLPEAKALYRQVLAVEPHALDIRYLLAMIAHQEGDHEAAAESLEEVLAADPDYPEALYLAGMVAYRLGRYGTASERIARALTFHPEDADGHYHLGNALSMRGRPDEAGASYRRALALRPDHAEAHFQLGKALAALGLFAEAIASLQRTTTLRPDHAEAHFQLGNAYAAAGQPEQAAASYRRVLELAPDNADTHNNLGNALLELGRPQEAAESLRRAVALRPDDAETCYNLGNAEHALFRHDQAMAAYRRAIELDPRHVDAHAHLGTLLIDVCRFDEAVASFRSALELRPDDADAHGGLGLALLLLGRLDEAAANCRRAITLRPAPAACSNYLMILDYQPGITPADILREHRAYAERFEAPWRAAWPARPRSVESGRKLRLGFVSGDFRLHPVGIFLMNVLAHFDRRVADIVLYSTNSEADDITQRLRSFDLSWHSLVGVPDDVAFERIRADGIDILVDLSGHTGHNRLPLFARKPAPVQVTWLGYWATTGLRAMDCILCTREDLPPGEADHFTEQPWYLPDSRWCFTPPDYPILPVPPPASASGFVTFGCFNNMAKVNDAVIAVWARILRSVPESRLYLKAIQLNEPSIRQSLTAKFAAHGIESDRLLMQGPSSHRDYLAAYHRLDIALDPFPFTGGVTSFESLWMGVPFVTKRGDRMVARQGEGILRSVGLTDWIAADDDEYFAKAVAWATNLPRLAELRSQLRPRLLASPLCDAPRFARNLEAAFRGMWEAYCADAAARG